MAVTAAPAGAPDSIQALKRVKAMENEWETRLTSGKRESEAALERLRTEAAAAVRDAQTAADHDRVARVVQARAETETEAEAILAEGKKTADQALRGEGRRPADKRDAVLAIVLGSFGKD